MKNPAAMLSRMFQLISLFAMFTCVSCVSGGSFYPQGPADLAKSAMFLPKSDGGNLLSNTTYMLGPIDGLGRGRTVAFPNGEKGIAVTPGPHRISVAMIHGSSEFRNGMLTAEVEIPMEVKASAIYEPAGTVAGRHRVDLWIQERGTGKKASKVVSLSPKNHTPPLPPLMLPAS